MTKMFPLIRILISILDKTYRNVIIWVDWLDESSHLLIELVLWLIYIMIIILFTNSLVNLKWNKLIVRFKLPEMTEKEKEKKNIKNKYLICKPDNWLAFNGGAKINKENKQKKKKIWKESYIECQYSICFFFFSEWSESQRTIKCVCVNSTKITVPGSCIHSPIF